VYCQAQFQLAIAVAIELSLALLSLLNSPPTRPPVHPPAHPPTHPVKVSKQLSTAASKLDLEDNLNHLMNGRRPYFFHKWKTTSIIYWLEDDLIFLEYGRQPQSLENGRQPQSLENGRKPVLFVKAIQPQFL
jgi:hypothetical protein